jgi:hypothetical protein
MVYTSKAVYSPLIKSLKEQIEATTLSPFSIRTINTTLNKINNVDDKITNKNFTPAVLLLNKEITNPNSKHTFFGCLKSILKHTDLSSKIKPNEVKMIEKLFEVNRIEAEAYISNPTPNEKQQERHIPYKQLTEATKKASKELLTELERLAYALYTYQPPLRLDYDAVKLIDNSDETDTKTNTYNYETNTFMINEYKTAKVKAEPIVFQPPKALQKLILNSITDTPRAYLLYNENSGVNRPMTANMLGHFIQRISKKLFDIPISVSDIRHSFIAENNIHNTDDIELLYKNAYQMGHTYRVATNIYRKNYEDK